MGKQCVGSRKRHGVLTFMVERFHLSAESAKLSNLPWVGVCATSVCTSTFMEVCPCEAMQVGCSVGEQTAGLGRLQRLLGPGRRRRPCRRRRSGWRTSPSLCCPSSCRVLPCAAVRCVHGLGVRILRSNTQRPGNCEETFGRQLSI